MSVIFDQYSERLRRKRKSRHTISCWADVQSRLEKWLQQQGLTPERATMEDLEDYIAQLPLAPSSKNTHLRYIKAAYNYAAKRGALKIPNPALDIEEVLVDPKEPRVISTGELREIRDSLWLNRDWAFFHLLAYTGMRRSECTTLRWENVRLEEQTIYCVGKRRKARYIPIHPALGEVLAELPRATDFVIAAYGENGITAKTVQTIVRRMHPVYTPHDYRRTVTTSLARNGVEERLIDRIMGWSADSIRNRYYVNVATEELQRAILKLYADDPL